MFIDNVIVNLKAGNGGDGLVSFRHEKFVEKGGPNGGDGGHGGNIVFRASNNEHTLARYRYNRDIAAKDGQGGGHRDMRGASASDQIETVPVGTQIIDLNTNSIIADLTEVGQEAIVAKGGQGGFGNAHFKTSTRQAPLVAEKGTPGESKTVKLELKLIADVAIVGLPNAGKSTLLSVVTNAKPEIANYAFTTLRPNLGVVDYNHDSLLLADIPGLIEGAHLGRGLGHEFLRHVERTKVILHLIDPYQEDVTSSYQTIRNELERYSKKLADLPELVAITKSEGLDEASKTKISAALKPHIPSSSTLHFISASAHIGTDRLIIDLYNMVTTVDASSLELSAPKDSGKTTEDDIPVFRVDQRQRDREWNVTKSKDSYHVTGSRIEDFAHKTFFEDYHSQMRLLDVMKRFGILHEIKRLGYASGQQIIIGDPEIGRLTLFED